MTYIKRKSLKQENRTAKDFGGKVQPGSGSIESVGMKADVKTGERTVGFNDEDFLIENKYTDKEFYSLNFNTWKKVKKEALEANMRIPAMQVDIGDESYFIVDDATFQQFPPHPEGSGLKNAHEYELIRKKSFRIKNEKIEEVRKHLASTLGANIIIYSLIFEGRGTLHIMEYDDFQLLYQ